MKQIYPEKSLMQLCTIKAKKDIDTVGGQAQSNTSTLTLVTTGTCSSRFTHFQHSKKQGRHYSLLISVLALPLQQASVNRYMLSSKLTKDVR